MPRLIRALAAALAAVVVVACAAAQPDAPTDAGTGDGLAAVGPDEADLPPGLDHLERRTVRLVRAADGGHVDVVVAVPATETEFRRGLMEVPYLADGSGMLFDFGRERTGGFWMKDTLVPLDIAFATADGEVRTVLTMTPCETEPCPTYDPGIVYRYALEVPQGWLEANDLGAGDRLEVDGGAGADRH